MAVKIRLTRLGDKKLQKLRKQNLLLKRKNSLSTNNKIRKKFVYSAKTKMP